MRCALGAGHQRHQLRLQIGRETRKRRGRHLNRPDAGPVARNANALIVDGNGRARLRQHIERRLQQFRPRARQLNITAGHRHRHRVSAGLDPIGKYWMPGAVELRHAFDDDARRPRAGDARAHLVQAIGDIENFRLAGGIADDGGALGQRAAISATWVPLTVTFGNSISAPFSPPGAFAMT